MRRFHVGYVVKTGKKSYQEYRLFEREEDADFTLEDFVENLLNEINVNGSLKVTAGEVEKIAKQLRAHKMIVLGKGVELKYPVIKELFEGDYLVLCPITRQKLENGVFSDVSKEEYEKFMKKHLFIFGEWSPIAKEMAAECVSLTCVRCDSITMVTPESINSKIKLDPPAAKGEWMDVYSCPKCPDASDARPGYKFTPLGDAYEKKRLLMLNKLQND